jgi:hypothetical protein
MENLLRDKLRAKIQLFSEDKTLPSPAKKQCIKAVTIDTLAHSEFVSAMSPRSKLFHSQVQAITGILEFDSPMKNTMVTRLALSFAGQQKVSTNLGGSPGVESAPQCAGKTLAFHQFPSPSLSSPSSSKDLWRHLPFTTYQSEHAAIQSLGPTAMVLKTCGGDTSNKSRFNASCEYGCNVESCGVKMRLSVFHHGPAAIQVMGFHIHRVSSWVEALSSITTTDPNKKCKKNKNIPLPPIVKAHAASILDAKPSIDPKDLIQDTIKHFGTHSLFATQILREVIGQKIYNFRRNKLASITGNNTKPKAITFTDDLMKFKEKYTLRLPEDFIPQPMDSEEHILELAQMLESRGYLKGKKSVPDMPHRDLIVLPIPDNDEPGMARVSQLSQTRTQPAAENTTIFTSLALLRNVCDCERLQWRVSLCGDFAHSTVCNDYMLLMIGVIDINHPKARGQNVFTKSYRPLAYALGQAEREEVALLTLLALKKIVRRLFCLEMKSFLGGMVSDHTHVFTNSFKQACPGSLLMQCYPHIIRKFRIDDHRKHNGGYRKFVDNTIFLHKIAIEDVRFLHGCCTKAMFRTLASLVIEGWIAEQGKTGFGFQQVLHPGR